ncbi:MAG: TonB-dependent receptor [Ginsengibacter sp.]
MSKNLLLLFYFKKVTTLGRKITILLFFYFLSSFSIAQQTINGNVTHDNVPLSGVSVKIKGTLRGTTTGIDGNFSIKADRRETLVFSSVGYEEQEIEITNGSDLHVQMISTASTLGEVVVVGFGTQKKMNLTGSVSTVSSTELETKNVAKGSLALAGELSGVSVRQASGNPGKNSAKITIRGLGSFSGAGTNPLVLVDGIESSLDNIDPNDIKSVSVLKDAASASIYGSKAANGVILVETKMGTSGPVKISLYSYFGTQKATTMPQFLDSWDYAAAYNEALVNGGGSPRYTPEDIQKYRSGTDPINYPNFKHMDYLWTSGKGIQNKEGISFSGGSDKTKYLFSGSYFDQQGLVMKNFIKRYDMRLSVNSKIRDNMDLTVNLSGNNADTWEPSAATAAGIDVLTRGALRLTNRIPGPLPDGYFGTNETIHPEADLNSKSFVNNKDFYLYGNVGLTWNFIKNFKMSGRAGYTNSTNEYNWFVAAYKITPTMSITPNKLTNRWSKGSAMTLQYLLEYEKSFSNHFIHLLGGYSQQQYKSSFLGAFRDQFPNNDIYEIDAGAVAHGTQTGNASQSKLRSYFGRANYSYLDKYLFEANIRYDGSSRFAENNRFGVFPSVSAGWRISQENFFRNALPWMNDLKIRGSWGKLGNQSVPDYPYQNLYSLSQNYPFGSALSSGAAILTLANTNITWEKTAMKDVGLDMTVLNGRLSFTGDYFVKTTSDILYNISASGILGATPAQQNAGTVENKGWDFDVSYKGMSGNFSYGVSANISFVKNRVISLSNVTKDVTRGLFVGYPMNSRYGYIADGLFVDAADVAKYPAQPYIASPGTIRFKDISGPQGVPDGVVNSTYDRTIIGQPFPTSTYGLTLNAKYKGLDMTVLFQGEGGRKDYVAAWEFFAFDNDGNVQKWMYDNRWTPDNPNPNAGYPKMDIKSTSYLPLNQGGSPSTFWLKSATFLRLKNIQIGYTLPTAITNKLSLKKVRLFANGENLFTIDNFYPGMDPEMNVSDSYGFYPLTRTLLFGINVNL